MAAETFHQSLWSALTPAAEPMPALVGDVTADIVIVGAGFLGLSTALHMAEGGAKVVLLEADEPGFGASGRNTGFVVPSLKTAFGPADVRGLLGEAGDRLTALVGQSGNIVFDLIRRHAIDCSAEQTGWLQPAHTAGILSILEQRQRDWAVLGRRVEILSRDETAEKIGAPGYHGALLDPTGGQINPLAYARGLARAAREQGVAIHARSRVQQVARADGKWMAVTEQGRVRADRLLLTTNALVDRLYPAVADAIIPVRVHQIASQRFGEAEQASILHGRSPVADTRRHTFAVRWSPDGRLVTGGLVMPGPMPLERATRYFSKRLQNTFPALGPIRAEHVWSGVIAATLDSMPRFMSLEPGLDAAIGCNGRGIALTTSLGRAIAGLYTGTLAAGEFPLPHKPPQPVPGKLVAQYGPAFWLPWSNLRDRLESSAGPAAS